MSAIAMEWLDEVDSTNAEARRRAEAGERGPLWIAARRQTAGRGRSGRAWQTGEGNLAATLLIAADRPPAEMAQLSFVAALAVADLAGRFVSPALISLKWPNDPLIQGRKAGGILIEAGGSATNGWAAVGIGVNLRTAPSGALHPATALADHMAGPPPPPAEALAILADAFARWRETWRAAGFEPIAEAWMTRAHGLGEPCRARLPTGEIHGIAEGIDPDGALRLRLPDGSLRRITAGDVFLAPRARAA